MADAIDQANWYREYANHGYQRSNLEDFKPVPLTKLRETAMTAEHA
jgi:hypothetical protein